MGGAVISATPKMINSWPGFRSGRTEAGDAATGARKKASSPGIAWASVSTVRSRG
jgi:hypothetical protein